jgi:C1A family cysteine protease
MNNTFSIAMLTAVASAAPGGASHHNRPDGKLGQDPEFLRYISKFNKNYGTTEDFIAKQGNFHNLDKVIKQTNKKADASTRKDPVRLAHNKFSDMSHEEFVSYLGLDQSAEGHKSNNGNGNGNGGNGNGNGRNLQAASTSVDWFADGYVTAVKDQGACGSCWAFAATTALESARAIKYDQSPIHLSEQQLTSCATSYGVSGCNGGLMVPAWNYFNDVGAMTNAQYPYVSGNTQVDGTCSFDSGAVTSARNSWSWVAENTEAIKAAVDLRPVTIAIDASSYVFQAYSSGVIRDADNCGNGFNHAVVIVGYTDGGSPTPGPEPTPEPTPTPEPLKIYR